MVDQLEKVDEQGHDSSGHSDAKRSEIRTVITRTRSVTIRSTSLPHQGNMDGNSAIRTGRSSWTQPTGFTSAHATQIMPVNIEHTVTTRRWSTIGVDSAITRGDSHAPSSIDIFDFVPANKMMSEWIKDFHTLIGENNAGFDESRISRRTQSDRNEDARHNVLSTLVATGPDIASQKKFDEDRDSNVSTSAKNFDITVLHNAIFPQVSEVLS
jgi:hypothetical protein